MIDLEKIPEKDVIFHFNTYFWIDKKGYLRLEGDGYLELYGKKWQILSLKIWKRHLQLRYMEQREKIRSLKA